MSLARAFTARMAKGKILGGDGLDNDIKPRRMNTVKGHISPKVSSPRELVHTTNMLPHDASDIRKGLKISGPVQLIHTTNMLSYDAPDILKEPKTAVSTSSLSMRSDADSDTLQTAASTPPTSPDSAFPGGLEIKDDDNEAPVPIANYPSSYFALPARRSSTPPNDVPDLPTISKQAHSHSTESKEPVSRKMSLAERVGRKRSMPRLSEQFGRSASKVSGAPPQVSLASKSTTPSSHYSIRIRHEMARTCVMPPPVAAGLSIERAGSKDASPFSTELAQVTELAEEYATRASDEKSQVRLSSDDQVLADRGLLKFTAEEYLSEVQGLFSTFFGGDQLKHAKSTGPQWI